MPLPTTENSSSLSAVPTASTASLLLVEDNGSTRESLSEILTVLGFQVETAVHGKDALDYLEKAEHLPCLILLDLMMPVMDGWEFMAVMRNHEALNQIPIIILSGAAWSSEQTEVAGTKGFLKKPIRLAELEAMVQEHCGMHER